VKKIFVGNLDFDTGEDQIRELFQPYGAVRRVSIAADWETGHSRGFAFVEMVDDRDAGQAVKSLKGTRLDGRSITVHEARPVMPRGFGSLPRDHFAEPPEAS